MNIKEKIMQQEVELAKIVAIETVRENLDMALGKILEDLGELDTDRYLLGMTSLTFRELLSELSSEVTREPNGVEEGSTGDVIEADFVTKKSRAKAATPVKPAVKKEKKKAPPRAVSAESSKSSSFDDAVLAALNRFEKASMNDIKDHVGGSPAKVRASLNRLIESGVAGFEGKTRSTRYFQT
jgi:hypothetical protein